MIIVPSATRFMMVWIAPVMWDGRYTMFWKRKMTRMDMWSNPSKWQSILQTAVWESTFLQKK